MTLQETFNALIGGLEVVITNKQYLIDNEVKSTLFTVNSIHSDHTITLIDFTGNLFYELCSDDILLF
jgi:hypothetical protein